MNSNSKDGNGNTSLCLSLRTNAEDFRKLLVAGADPFSKEENILEKCVMLDDLSFLNVLLQEQGTTFICNSLFSKFWERQNGVTFLRNRSLIAAVTLQMLSSPKELNVNVINRLRTTPLLYFCEQNEDVVVERLLERGADVNIIDNHGRTALHTVLHSEDKNVRYHILSLLMKKNPDLNIKDASGMTVFQRAMEEYEGYLCNRRTDFKWLSVFMKEALLAGEICGKSRLNFLLVLASHRKHFNFMTILVDKGADLSVKEYQSGILHLCWSRKFHDEERQNESYKEFLDFLLIFKKHGGKLDDVDRNGNTPLLLFLKHGLNDFDDNQDKLVDLIDEIVSLLACDGSTVRKRDKTGLSAIQIVSSKGWLSTMKILVQKGANISEKDDKQNTRRHLCLMGGIF
ncbi:ankyrin repeat domain-containing protein 50-like [Saccostrea cucullata]|uniref:ankyrin repeat domain-containing protein 50-like n=1 Tax=Saccostrea cuccullata TaxID=36930 RepID=UPI002ED4D1D2